MQIGVVGAGYVGLTAGVCLAEMGNSVVVVDNDEAKIALLKAGRSPHFEPQLDELRVRNQANRRLSFGTSVAEAVRHGEVVFVAVGTPSTSDGDVDLSALEAAMCEIADAMDGYRVIAIKSTVPPGTNSRMRDLVASRTQHSFDMVSNPEFLKEGTAINDFMHPDRVVIGARTDTARNTMRQVYNSFFRTAYRVMETDPESAEMIKYAANVMLAARISLMNEFARICQNVGADVEQVRVGVGLDRRIGTSFLFPGLGYGGSCFPKDVLAMTRLAEQAGIADGICHAVHATNARQWNVFLPFVEKELGTDLTGKVVTLLGLSYKPRTDDVRESPALHIAQWLLERGAMVRGFDPEAGEKAKKALPQLEIATDIESALHQSDALFLCTEWNEFRTLNWEMCKRTMRRPLIFDGRNIYSREEMEKLGVIYYSVGRNTISVDPSR